MELSLESLYLDTGFKGLINSKSNLHVCDHLQYPRITPKKFSQSKHLKKHLIQLSRLLDFPVG